MAVTQKGHWYSLACEELIKGKLVPWTCAFSAMCLLAVHAGPLITAAIVASGAALLLLVLGGLRLLDNVPTDSIHMPSLPSLRERLSIRFSRTRATEILEIAV